MNRLHFLLTLVATAGLSLSAQAAEIYSNSFDTFDGNSETAFSANGWSGYLTRADGAVTDETGGANATSGGTAKDPYLFAAPRIDGALFSTAADAETLMFTTEVPTVSLASLESISVDRNFDGSVADAASGRFAIQIGSTWYASDFSWSSTTNNGPGGAFTTSSIGTAPSFDFTDGSNWLSLNIILGTTGTGEITLGSTVGGTLAGNVTAYGVYVEHGNGGDHARIDNFKVSAIPEPSMTGLIALGIFSLLLRRKNCR